MALRWGSLVKPYDLSSVMGAWGPPTPLESQSTESLRDLAALERERLSLTKVASFVAGVLGGLLLGRRLR